MLNNYPNNGDSFDRYLLRIEELCEKSCYITPWDEEKFQNRYTDIQGFLCNLLFKQGGMDSPKKLIRKNQVNVSTQGRR
jgi:NADH:ubiquinone oxidoreductase subunit D